ncbi:MAG: hypothetical protein ABH854_04575 [Candidatus Diapherotrites archaeon]
MIIDDFLVLGRACPDRMRDGRFTVCCGGHSERLGFVRIYPTPPHAEKKLQRWNLVSVEVERDARDKREESWKIAGAKSDWRNTAKGIEVLDVLSREERLRFINGVEKTTIEKLKESGKTLGIVEPRGIEAHIRKFPAESPQTDLLGRTVLSKRNFPHRLYLKYFCAPKCTERGHDHQLLEWGVYEFWRKNPQAPAEKVAENLRLQDREYGKFFFVGNQAFHPNNFMVISVLRHKV